MKFTGAYKNVFTYKKLSIPCTKKSSVQKMGEHVARRKIRGDLKLRSVKIAKIIEE